MTPSPNNPQNAGAPASIDPVKLQSLMQEMKDQQNLALGLVGGIAAAVVAAVIWAVITVLTDYQIGWMAIGVGLLVGYAVRLFGKGIDKVFGFMGAILSLLGCLAGNVLTVMIVIARQEAVSFLEVALFFVTSPGAMIEALAITFSPIDLLFYGLAIYEGYKFAFRRITQAELAALMK